MNVYNKRFIYNLSNLPKTEVYALLQHHYTRLGSKIFDEYKNQRVNSVKSLLKKNNHFPLSKTYKKENNVFEDSDFEPSCSGVYESCKAMEITNDDLLYLQDSNYRGKTKTLVDMNPGVHPRSSTLKFVHPHKQPKLNENVETTNNIIATTTKDSLSCDKANINELYIGENKFRTAREILLSKTIQVRTYRSFLLDLSSNYFVEIQY